jgi:hypothetical protein
MFKSLNNSITKYYQFSFIFIMISTLGAVFYFWKLGFIDGSRGKALNKASFTFETLNEENFSKEITKIINTQNYKNSLDYIDRFSKKTTYVDSILTHETYQDFNKSLNDLKSQTIKLISSPKTGKVLSVLNDKLDKFNDYVKNNNWRTLTRMSSRIMGLSSGRVSSKELPDLVSRIDKDLNQMAKITENSVLSDADKAEIKSRISNLMIETSMLLKFVEQKKLFAQKLEDVNKQQAKWFEAIGPELSMQKLQVERMGRYYLMGMLGVVALTFSLFMLGLLIGKKFNQNSQAKMEALFEEIVNENILNQVMLHPDNENFTQNFKQFISQISDYINKRMSFGTIFQEAMPFSSIMLDKNLKVNWANKQFSEDWKVSQEEATKDYMSWDYLNKLTNIGYDDPILEALKHNVAGIYQIQVKPDQDSEVKPYEMFVSPVRYNNEKKIMLFFYPLTSIHDTIKDQAKSIMNPIQKTVFHLRDRSFDNLDLNQLRSEYAIGGIESMLDYFIEMDEALKEDKKDLTQKIGELYKEIEELESIQDELLAMNAHAFRNSKGQIDYLKDFKEGVISLSTQAKSLNLNGKEIHGLLSKTFSQLDQKAKDLNILTKSYQDLQSSLPNFEKVKVELKDSKTSTMEAKSKLANDLSDLVHFKKKISNPDAIRKFQEIYNKIANDFNSLDGKLMDLSKRIIQLEVSLSKTHMLFNNSAQTLDSIDSSYNLRGMTEQEMNIKSYETKLEKSSYHIKESEEKIINSLQSIYKGFKTGVKYQSDMGRLIAEHSKEGGKGHVNPEV